MLRVNLSVPFNLCICATPLAPVPEIAILGSRIASRSSSAANKGTYETFLRRSAASSELIKPASSRSLIRLSFTLFQISRICCNSGTFFSVSLAQAKSLSLTCNSRLRFTSSLYLARSVLASSCNLIASLPVVPF